MPRQKVKLSYETRLVRFLNYQGFNSAQVRHICTKILHITGPKIHKKIDLNIADAEWSIVHEMFSADSVKGLTGYSDIVTQLKLDGYNSSQAKFICVKILNIKDKNIYNKIKHIIKDVEISEARRRFREEKIADKLVLMQLI